MRSSDACDRSSCVRCNRRQLRLAGSVRAVRNLFHKVTSEGKWSMSSSTIWISYDLGVRGDYEGLYAWLDQHKAKECGDSVALLSYRYSGVLVEALKADLGESVETNKRTRMYV